MAVQRFNFPYHKVKTEYPESSVRVQFGSNFTFTAKPDSEDMRNFILTFPVMKAFEPTENDDGTKSPDLSSDPQINIAVLEKFYQDHRLHTTFIYPHPHYGDVKVKFNKPLKIPEGQTGGDGAIKNITVELMEQPA